MKLRMTFKGFLFIALFSLILAATLSDNSNDKRWNRYLNTVAMIQSHDSVTGEISNELWQENILNRFVKTQSNTIVEQLDCGARSLDLRPYLAAIDGGTLYAHHGAIIVDKKLEDTLDEILSWGRRNPTELVVITFTHCVDHLFANYYYSPDCRTRVLDLLASKNIKAISNCSDISMLTYGQALSKGTILAEFGCARNTWYDKEANSLACWGKDPVTNMPYSCHRGEFFTYFEDDDETGSNAAGTDVLHLSNKPLIDYIYKSIESRIRPTMSKIPWDNMKASLVDKSKHSFVYPGSILWIIYANWQSTADSILLASLYNSSVVLDEELSGINRWLAKHIRRGMLPNLNILCVDNVCDGGLELLSAINHYFDQ